MKNSEDHKRSMKRLDEMLKTIQEIQTRLDEDRFVTLEAQIAKRLEK